MVQAILRPPQTDNELYEFVETVWGIRIPRKQVCPNHRAPFEAFADAYFARNRVSVWQASRGFGGKSFLLATLGLTVEVALGADVTILGGSSQQSGRVHQYMRDAWRSPAAPYGLLASDPTLRETHLTNGGHVIALMASEASARGPHPQRTLCDEIDEMDLVLLDAAMGQAMASRGIAAATVLSSTHHHADGTMTEVKRRAAEKGWPFLEWCYRETMEPHGWLSPADVEAKKDDVTAAMWAVEYENQEPSPEGRAILPDAVEAMFSLAECQAPDNQEMIFEEPVPGATYGTGADWAKSVDWTVIITIRADAKPWRVVAFRRLRRRPWPVMVDAFENRIAHYALRGAAISKAAHDGTGLGTVIVDLLKQPADDLILVGRERSDLFNEWIKTIENAEVISPRIASMYADHKYCAVDDLYGAGHPPDSFVAAALARHVLSQKTSFEEWKKVVAERTAQQEAEALRNLPGAGRRPLLDLPGGPPPPPPPDPMNPTEPLPPSAEDLRRRGHTR